jgi:hypothetical protein
MLQDFLFGLVGGFFRNEIAGLKIKGAICYVKAVAEARRIFIIYTLLRCAIILMLAGFVLVHVAVFAFLPWTPLCKMVVLLLLGSLYILVSLSVVLYMCSQKYWMHMTGASKLVDEVTGNK